MLFIDALSRSGTLPNKATVINKEKLRYNRSSKDSVDLSSAANEVKEIHLDSRQKFPLSASSSIFANLIEHIINHIFDTHLTVLSPEELNFDNKDWQLYLQVPPSIAITENTNSSYQEPAIQKRPQTKQLTFRIPVKPHYGNPVEMTVLLSAHRGSPDVPTLFSSLPKENTLAILKTPYLPEFLAQQITHYHVFLDQDGEEDQLAPLYPYNVAANDHLKSIPEEVAKNLLGLRLWRAKGNSLQPALLADAKIGLLFVGHYQPIIGKVSNQEEQRLKEKNLSIKA